MGFDLDTVVGFLKNKVPWGQEIDYVVVFKEPQEHISGKTVRQYINKENCSVVVDGVTVPHRGHAFSFPHSRIIVGNLKGVETRSR